MPDKGRDREIKQFVEAREAELVRESKRLENTVREKQSEMIARTKKRAAKRQKRSTE